MTIVQIKKIIIIFFFAEKPFWLNVITVSGNHNIATFVGHFKRTIVVITHYCADNKGYSSYYVVAH